MEQRFVFGNKAKTFAGILAVAGLVLFLLGAFTTEHTAQRAWTSILFNNLFFTWIALIGGFFVAAFGLGYSGWHTLIKRIPEAMGHFIVPGIIMILVIFVLGGKHIYEWTDHHVIEQDGLLQVKQWWLNSKMFILFTLGWLAAMGGMFYLLRRNSVKLDETGDYRIFNKSLVISAVFCFFFAVMNSVSTWHWVMSTEPHWYSTLYGWYLFASSLVSGIAVMTLILIFLKRQGYLPRVNMNHFHDLGKFLFAFSVFWTYLWFSQHMLIWYANIPEETVHFRYLYDNHGFLFFFSLILNFLIPLIVLMSRDAKRNLNTLMFVSCVILLGHWIDFFLMIRPGADKFLSHHKHEHIVQSIGITEIGAMLMYAGIFIFVTLWALTKANIVPLNHPFERESVEHHI
ncbi:MAG: hypothetical protein KTR13_10430 [Saprospiraceae bacterium]|nr:hypothetical protein [Saprospiraceae bacterium]